MDKARRKLICEQNKLDALIDEALENGTPLCETVKIMTQCQKIHDLMLEMEEMQKEKA